LVTIKDIAKAANVSTAAVSLALNNKGAISESKRAEIFELADKLGYVPNQNARNLINGKSNNIAVLFHYETHSVNQLPYMPLINSILSKSSNAKYNLAFSVFQQDIDELPGIIKGRNIAGVLIIGDTNKKLVANIAKLGLPIVVLDASCEYEGCFTVSVDYKLCSKIATNHLLELGHRNIAFLGNQRYSAFTDIAFSGFKEALEEYDVCTDNLKICLDACDASSLRAGVDSIVRSKDAPTAIFCTTDIYAIYAIQYLMSIGIKVPDDISVIGIDDDTMSHFTTPQLTTMQVDWNMMGARGYTLLTNAIEGKPCESNVLPSDILVKRDSVAPPKK